MFPNPITFPDSTKTAQQAANSLGCSICQIAKSIIFQTKDSQKPILVIASGSNRINEKLIGNLVGEEIIKADADFVKNHTGFVIGGVPPYGHKEKIITFIDRDLQNYDFVWASAGTPNSVFKTNLDEIQKNSSGKTVEVK